MTNCPPSLRGDLSKWLCEINTGVYVGNVSSRVRDAIWDRVCENLKNGQATLTDFFNKMSDVLERQFGDDEVYAAVIAPEIELTITPLANVRSYLPCFDEADSCYSISEDVPLALCYDPRQVITLAGKRYLSGAVVFVRYDTNGSFVALTTSDLYLIQCYLAENSVPLMAGREKMVCICID